MRGVARNILRVVVGRILKEWRDFKEAFRGDCTSGNRRQMFEEYLEHVGLEMDVSRELDPHIGFVDALRHWPLQPQAHTEL